MKQVAQQPRIAVVAVTAAQQPSPRPGPALTQGIACACDVGTLACGIVVACLHTTAFVML